MQVQIGKRKKIQFTDRVHPVMGIVSLIMGVVAMGGLITLCILSGNTKGNSGLIVGVMGMLAMLMSIVGFFLAIKCYRRDDIYMVTPTLGSIVNGIMVIIFLLLFFMGAM